MLGVGEDLLPQTAPEPVAFVCSLPRISSLHILSAMGRELWGGHFTDKKVEAKRGSGRAGSDAPDHVTPEQGLTSESI